MDNNNKPAIELTNRLSYYQAELNKVNPRLTQYAPTIKIFANTNGQDTKHISLNKESAEVLINWLTKYYL